MTIENVPAKAKSPFFRLSRVVKGFMENAFIGFIIESKKPKDIWIYGKAWVIIWANIVKFLSKFIFKRGPINLVRTFLIWPGNNRWLLYLLLTSKLMRRLCRGRTGLHLEATCMIIGEIVASLEELLEEMYFHPELQLLMQFPITPEIPRAMGLNVWQIELLGVLLPLEDEAASEKYIDEAESRGIPPDACSFVKAAAGVVFNNAMANKGLAIVGSNLACDALLSATAIYEKALGLPTYRLDVPYYFMRDGKPNEEAEELFADDLEGMIAFLEKNTPGRMDWNKLKELCENRNRAAELEIELWELQRVKPAPMADCAIWLSHLWFQIITPGHPAGARVFKRLVEMAKKNVAAGGGALENERYRMVLCDAFAVQYPDLYNWAERTYGIALVMDTLAYSHQTLIDTSTPRTMLKGLGRIMMQGPMSRNIRGPAENYTNDYFQLAKQWDLDFLWIQNHVLCKGTNGFYGMLRDMCREKNLPVLFVDYDLIDPRSVSQENMRRQVDHFMKNVMKAEPLRQ
jgi:benzoyl-CoA reductase/2-hydroxyglutaryl-CoA dehydratase subunit BcrC/BadD/HgdB